MSDNRIAPEIIELIRRTSTVGGCKNVFSLAPRGNRVGFYFQQRRATLLAKALRDRLGENGLKSARIAVIGAGITGVTFFLSLLHFGAENAFLYEASDDLLNTGADAAHRLVHPNYNRWPTLGSMDIFTSLPVLNWCAGSGKEVVAQLRKSVEDYYSEEKADRFRPKHRCIRVTERKPEFSNSVRVLFENDSTKHEEDFNFVVLAVGFGDESCVTWGLEDYWTMERNPLDVGAHKREARVFGTGDGALIDILRCCAKKPDDAWEIPLGLIGMLRDKEANVLQEDRLSGPTDPRSLAFTDLEIEIQRHEESIRAASWQIAKKSGDAVISLYVAQEWDFYRDIVRRLKRDQRGLCEFLEDRLKPVADLALRPKLIGTLEAPFEPTSAPINKLLVAYLRETHRIEYECWPRDKTEAELKKIKRTARKAAATKIEICRYGVGRNFPPPETNRPPKAVDVFVNGIGPRKKPAETDLESQLIDLMSGLSGGEYVYFDAMPHPLALARNGHDQDRLSHSMRESFKPVLEVFARSKLEATNVDLIKDPPKWVIKTEMHPNKIKNTLRMLGGIDGVFCGAAIVVARAPQPDRDDF